MFAVEPKLNCPHFAVEANLLPPERWALRAAAEPTPERPFEPLIPEGAVPPCSMCAECDENWVCLGCMEVGCSRYRHGHALAHSEASGHCLTISLSDLSVMCYACDEYVKHELAKPALRAIYYTKFGELMPEGARREEDAGGVGHGPNLRTLVSALDALPTFVPAADSADACAICHEPVRGTRVAQLPCGHAAFHKACLATWVLRQNECPVCRQPVLEEWARNVLVPVSGEQAQ